MTINTTERTRPEPAQRESEERYRTLFESIDEGVCIIEMMFDEQGKPFDYRFLETNPTFEQQMGLEGAAGKTARELVPNLEGHWFEIYGKVALTGEAVRFVNGSEAMNRWFDVYAVHIGGAESRQVAILFTDITERKQAERALRESERRLRLASGAAQLGVFEWSVAEDRAFWENERMYEIFGRAREDGTISKAEFYESYLHPDDVAMFEQALLDSMKPDNSLHAVCRMRRKPDDELRWLEFAGNVELAPDGTPLRLVSVIADTPSANAPKKNCLSAMNTSVCCRMSQRGWCCAGWTKSGRARTNYIGTTKKHGPRKDTKPSSRISCLSASCPFVCFVDQLFAPVPIMQGLI